MQIEEYLARDDRAVLPVGSTEQHAYLSLATDSILAERVAVVAAEPLGVLVLPAMPFGVASGFAAFPGTVSLSTATLVAVVSEVLDTSPGRDSPTSSCRSKRSRS
jgi:creatinine amidohydrolase